jgi:hypothetical protein
MKPILALGIGSLLLAAACGGAPDAGDFDFDGSAGSAGPGGGDGSASIGTSSGDGAGPVLGVSEDGGGANANGGCSAASQLVYVLSTSNDIYSFDPPTKVFTKMSTLQCQAGSMTPNSMAVDRQGNAWVNYASESMLTGQATGGSIFKVDIATGACAATNITLSSDWYQVGMGYSTASATDTTDTLYITATNSGGSGCQGGGLFGGGGNTSEGLASVDTDAGTVTPIGPFSGSFAGQSAELTGTGDGRLFGFFVISPLQVAQISKTSGATSNPITMTGVQCPQAWAFSFWGGDFYLYTAPDEMTNSTVTHYTTADGGIDTSYVTDAGFVIVGAGVSTCAPTTPPAPK